MISVSVQAGEQAAARELFELLKTQWEFHHAGRSAEIVVATTDLPLPPGARLLLRFLPRPPTPAVPAPPAATAIASLGGQHFPLFAACQPVAAPARPSLLHEARTGQPLLETSREREATVVRFGYALFAEIHFLLTEGQPAEFATTPTLELHLAVLREVITRAGFPFIEIPPVPAGHRFLACLTHDIDHPLVRNHVADHTAAGFLARATVGSAVAWARGRLPFRRVVGNWLAVCRLPFVHARLARDFWRNFDLYREREGGRPSTVFVIPRRGHAGRLASGPAPAKRACGYDLAEIAPDLQRVQSAGSEIGVHGIDAWIDPAAGEAERARVAGLTGPGEMGIRMHWLYFSPDSPRLLEQAGYSYDSTVGYNEAIGFRAGTTQVYQPPATQRLLELPLHIMDTALFYPDHLDLTEAQAAELTGRVLDEFGRHGGVVTLNWHDRSIAPERQWGEFYQHLLAELQRRDAWFGTAAQAIAWFRQRRQASIRSVRTAGSAVAVGVDVPALDSTLPGLRIRLHKPHAPVPPGTLATGPAVGFVDGQIDPSAETHLNL